MAVVIAFESAISWTVQFLLPTIPSYFEVYFSSVHKFLPFLDANVVDAFIIVHKFLIYFLYFGDFHQMAIRLLNADNSIDIDV